jgi:hypothetical protein
MPAYNFKDRFAHLVESGEKRQTIRRLRKRGNPKPGDLLQLYTGMRTKLCRRLRPDEECIATEPITIGSCSMIIIQGRFLDFSEADSFARADGFGDIPEFVDFFEENYGLPFSGILIKW